jgi:beta-N-acetylhexosaminidase
MALGATRDSSLAYLAGKITAQEARAIGVHITFSPVLDINNDPGNPIINVRSYGEDPILVSQMGLAFSRGAEENGLLTTAKHFPGHGNSHVDTHTRLGTIEGGLEELNRVELHPYRFILGQMNLAGIMTAHLWVRAIDSDTVPATLSPRIVRGLLRDDLKFDGIVFTDAMVMGGITSRYTVERSTVLALEARCDVILFPGDVARAFGAIVQATKNGQISEERISESARRVLLAKSKVGLHLQKVTDTNSLQEHINARGHYERSKQIAERAITLVKDSGHLLPLKTSKRVLVVTVTNQSGNSMISRGLVSFPDHLKKHISEIQYMAVGDSLTGEEEKEARGLAQNSNIVVIGAYIKVVINRGTVDLSDQLKRFLRGLLGYNKNVVLVSFGSPYIISAIPELPTYICCYDNCDAMQEVAAEMLVGNIKAGGRLPVTISEKYKSGWRANENP